jgi:hypothetical protein
LKVKKCEEERKKNLTKKIEEKKGEKSIEKMKTRRRRKIENENLWNSFISFKKKKNVFKRKIEKKIMRR